MNYTSVDFISFITVHIFSVLILEDATNYEIKIYC